MRWMIIRNRIIDPVRAWKSPTSAKQLKQILGAASYYRKFIEGFADKTVNLRALT